MALQIVQEAFAQGKLKEGGLITEGTAGSTGHLVGCMNVFLCKLVMQSYMQASALPLWPLHMAAAASSQCRMMQLQRRQQCCR